MKKKIVKRTTLRNKAVLQLGNKANTDNRLTYINLILQYAFEYGVNLDARTITITQDIEAPWFDIVDAALTLMEREGKETVTIRIHSPGGAPYEAMAIVGRMRRSKCHIVTEGYGHVMSAACLLLASGKKRRMDKNAQFMWHESSYALEGRHSVVKEDVRQIEREEKLWAKNMAELTNKPEKFWLEHGTGKDSYFTAEQLLQIGVIDELF